MKAALERPSRFEFRSFSSGNYFSWSATLSIPACEHGSSQPGQPDTPTPPIVSSPTLIGRPPSYGVAHKNKIGDESRDRGIKQDPRLDHKYWSALRGRGVESACVRGDVGDWHLADIGLFVANVCC